MKYIASPYAHELPEIRAARCVQVEKWIADNQTEFEEILYSPIAHYHDMAVRFNLPTNWQFWWNLNKQMIDMSSEVIVVQIEGWGQSKGITAEIEYAKETGKPVVFTGPSQI